MAQRDPLHSAALHGGRRARRPQCGQQQRRRGQPGPAAVLPARAVRGPGDRPQLGDQRGPVGRAVGGVFGQPGGHQRAQRLGDRLEWHWLGQVLVQHALGRVPRERWPAGQALIERGRGRVHIARRGGRAPAELLGRRVRQGARRHGPVPGPRGDAEVGQLAGPGPVDQHVLRLVVPVHHPAPVRGGQPQQGALQHHQRRLGRGLPVPGQDVPQRHTVDQFHHDRRPARRLQVLIQPDHVRVLQRGQHRRLSPEQRRELRVGQQLTVQVLDRHQGAGRILPGQHHLAESARAQHLQLGEPGNLPLRHADPPPSGPPPASSHAALQVRTQAPPPGRPGGH